MGTRTTHFLLYCSAITSHLIPTIPLLYCINSSLLTAIYTARQLCAFRSLRQHASHLFYETITGSYCLATPEPSPPILPASAHKGEDYDDEDEEEEEEVGAPSIQDSTVNGENSRGRQETVVA